MEKIKSRKQHKGESKDNFVFFMIKSGKTALASLDTSITLVFTIQWVFPHINLKQCKKNKIRRTVFILKMSFSMALVFELKKTEEISSVLLPAARFASSSSFHQ